MHGIRVVWGEIGRADELRLSRCLGINALMWFIYSYHIADFQQD